MQMVSNSLEKILILDLRQKDKASNARYVEHSDPLCRASYFTR